MSKYIITGDVNGVQYYMQFVTPDSPNLAPFVWSGIVNFATLFPNRQSAKNAMIEMLPYSKLPMQLKQYYGGKVSDVFEDPKETPPPTPELPPIKVNFDALDSFFQKHILFKQPFFAKQ